VLPAALDRARTGAQVRLLVRSWRVRVGVAVTRSRISRCREPFWPQVAAPPRERRGFWERQPDWHWTMSGGPASAVVSSEAAMP
jgi:hypothetical protein